MSHPSRNRGRSRGPDLGRIRNLAGLGLAWLCRRTTVPAPPIQIFIEPTNLCNYRCTYCPVATPGYREIPKGRIAVPEFSRILERVHAGAPSAAITLALGGEPFLHPELVELIRVCNEHNYVAGITSNGSLLTPQRSSELLGSEVRYGLLIDFCADPEIYQGYRLPGSWEQVKANLGEYLRQCQALDRPPALRLKDMAPAVEARLGQFPEEERRASLERLRALFPQLSPDRFTSMSLHNWTGEVEGLSSGHYTLCTHPYSSMAINCAGEVVACCRDLLYQYKIGSLLGDHSLLDLWNGPRMRTLRDGLRRRNFELIPLCRECDHPYRLWWSARSRLPLKLRASRNLVFRR